MDLKTVILRTAHYLADVWHPAGAQLDIPAEHFDPQLHTPIGWIPETTAQTAAKPDDATSISFESIPALLGGLHKRIDDLEQRSAGILDLASVEQRVKELEENMRAVITHAQASAQPPVDNEHVAEGAVPFDAPPPTQEKPS